MIRYRPAHLFVFSVTCLAMGIAMGNDQKSKMTSGSAKKPIDFNRDVRPILSDHCFKCHGPDGKEVKGSLRLSDAIDATRDRDGKFAIKRGNSSSSYLMQRVQVGSDDPMPPKGSGMSPLSVDQVSTLKTWIDQGAKYEKHWAFVPPKMPMIPHISGQAVIRNPIDNFIIEKLQAAGLKQEKEADPSTLLRRASLSLTGLLPTPDDIKQLENDKKSGAYERAIDRLLASERYGEHQAR